MAGRARGYLGGGGGFLRLFVDHRRVRRGRRGRGRCHSQARFQLVLALPQIGLGLLIRPGGHLDGPAASLLGLFDRCVLGHENGLRLVLQLHVARSPSAHEQYRHDHGCRVRRLGLNDRGSLDRIVIVRWGRLRKTAAGSRRQSRIEALCIRLIPPDQGKPRHLHRRRGQLLGGRIFSQGHGAPSADNSARMRLPGDSFVL